MNEDRIITLQKEITEDLWAIRGYLYNTISEIEGKIRKLEKIMEKEVNQNVKNNTVQQEVEN